MRPLLCRIARPAATSHLDSAAAWIAGPLGLVVAAGLAFGPAVWKSGPAMVYVRSLGAPWAVWAAVWVVYAVLVLAPRTRVAGFVLGVIPWGFYTLGVVWAGFHGQLLSIVGAAALMFVPLAHPLFARWAQIEADWRAKR